MGFDIGPCLTTESTDLIQVDIAGDCSEDVFAESLNPPILPNALSVPLALPSPSTGQSVPFNSSVNPSLSQYSSCVTQRNSWIPSFTNDSLGNDQKLQVLTTKLNVPNVGLGVQDIVNSWIAFKALAPADNGSGQRYMSIAQNAAPLVSVCESFAENESLPPPRIAVPAS